MIIAEYVGCDMPKEETAHCVMGRDGTDLACSKVPTDPAALFGAIKVHCLCPERIVPHKRSWLRQFRTIGCKADNSPQLCLVLWEAETFWAL